jgi:hypothetical protein
MPETDEIKPMPPPLGPRPANAPFSGLGPAANSISDVVREQSEQFARGGGVVGGADASQAVQRRAPAPMPTSSTLAADKRKSLIGMGVAIPGVGASDIQQALGGLKKSKPRGPVPLPGQDLGLLVEEVTPMPEQPHYEPPPQEQLASSVPALKTATRAPAPAPAPKPAPLAQPQAAPEEPLEAEPESDSESDFEPEPERDAGAEVAAEVGAEAAAEGTKWLAGCDYIPPEGVSDKLGFLEGDVVLVTVQHPGGWWFARLGNKEGWIPSDFMDPLPSDEEDDEDDDDDVAAALAAVNNAQATLVRLGSNASTMATSPQTSGNEQARSGQTLTKSNKTQSGPAAPIAPKTKAAGTPPQPTANGNGNGGRDSAGAFYEDMSDAIPVDLREAAAVERRASMRQQRTTAYEEMSLPDMDALRLQAPPSEERPAIIREDEYLEM